MSFAPNKKNWIAAVGIMLVPPLVCFLWLVGGPYTEAFPRPFNATIWKQANVWNETRCAMILDLQARVGLAGKTRREIDALLGPADAVDHSTSDSQWSLCPSFMDVWILEVHWMNDRVASTVFRDT